MSPGKTRKSGSSSLVAQPTGGLQRLELRIERLGLRFRFTFAFHAREIRFEKDQGAGFARVFPETFSFHGGSHDPAELFIQLEDLLNHPELLSPRATRRDAQELIVRLLSHAPHYLEEMRDSMVATLPAQTGLHFHQDLALFCQISTRFLESRDLSSERRTRVALFLMRKLISQSLLCLVDGRVDPVYLSQYIKGEVDPVDPSDDSSESGFYHTLEEGDRDAVDRMIMRMAERAFFLWIDGVCLDDDNQAFEKEDSPFDSRESEVLHAICRGEGRCIDRGQDLVPFLRRPSKDCRRILEGLERWLLRRYDVEHAAALIHHEAHLAAGELDGQRRLTWHTPGLHGLAILALMSPFIGAAFAFDRYPSFFNLVCSIEVAVVNAAAIWFLAYRFCWKRDLSFFHAAVPRIGAGIIVGYLPVFLIDEVWDLANQNIVVLGTVSLFLGLVTLLYIYVEVQRKLSDTTLAFHRARSIFALGVLQAFALGVVMTNLVGQFMAQRSWEGKIALLPGDSFGAGLPPLVGQLPRVLGIEPLYAFPSAVLIMTFLSFFIGIFLQLLWEELPLTEPL